MSQNIVSLVLTDEQINAAMDALTALEGALAGSISLDAEERRRLTKMGQKSEAFCRQSISVLAQNPQIVPPSLDLAGAQADLAAFDQLRPIAEALQRLHSRVDDTLAALGSDVMDVAYEGYGQLKLSGAAHGLDDLRRDLGSRFSRTRRKEAAVAVA